MSVLGSRVGRAVGWVIATKVAGRLLDTVQWLCVARWLAPEAFGLLSLVMFCLLALETCSNPGVQLTLIQSKEVSPEVLSTAWTVSLARSAGLALILWAASGLIGRFFNEPRLVPLLQVMSLSFVLSGLTHPGMALLAKALHFRRYLAVELMGRTAQVGSTLWLAWRWHNVWALIAGALIGAGVRAAASFWAAASPLRVRWRWREGASLWQFGRWLAVMNAAFFLFFYGDDAFVGKMLGTQELGYYTMAYKLSMLLVTELVYDLSQVLYPAYTQLDAALPRLQTAYVRVLHGLLVFSCAYAGGLWLLAGDAVGLGLGRAWLPAVPLIYWLCLVGITRTAGAATGPVLLARGAAKTLALWSLVQLAVMGALLAPCTLRWGTLGAAGAVLCASVVMQSGVAVHLIRRLGLRPGTLASAWVHPVVVAVAAVAMATQAARLLPAMVGAGAVVVMAAIYVGAYGLGLLLTDRWLPAGLRDNIRWLLRTVRQPQQALLVSESS
ncbi:MAG: lipopolysaccharide biosynthesis protein [Candidatus Omnitrophica bacterium]|nr:lipopolysaccharide biosynthesis protein [Candidatus Omnitrophota bacterium]